MKRFFILMTVLIALLTGCDPQTGTDAGNGGGTGSNTPSGGGNGGATGTAADELVSMDIADAESIYISTPTEAGETVSAKAGVTARTISERAAARGFAGSVLFKITKEGKAVEISLTWGNDKNENTAQLRPVSVHEAGPDYVITEFYNPTIRQSIAYLINKKSGKAYSLEEVGVPQRYGEVWTLHALTYTDNDGNIYYRTKLPHPYNLKSYDIVKIDVSDPAKPASVMMTLPQDYVEFIGVPSLNYDFHFIVDKAGNLVYDAASSSQTDGTQTRLLFKGGGFTVLPYDAGDFFINPEGDLYAINDSSSSIVKFKIDPIGKTVREEIYSTISGSIFPQYILEIGNKIVYVAQESCMVVYSDNPADCRFKAFDFDIKIDAIASTDSFYYISGLDVISDIEKLVEVNPFDGTYKVVEKLSDYAVYQLAFTDGQLTFGAVRQNDSKLILGKYNLLTGEVKILEEASGSNITYLTPIN